MSESSELLDSSSEEASYLNTTHDCHMVVTLQAVGNAPFGWTLFGEYRGEEQEKNNVNLRKGW